jgi:hypothetical protein
MKSVRDHGYRSFVSGLQHLLKPALLAGLSMGMVMGLASCKADEAPAPAEKETEAEPEKKPAVDQKIANAMAAAQANAQATSASAEGQVAPPADGIIGTEAAAREVAPGSPAQLVLGAEGGSPRVRLGAERSAVSSAPTGKLQLSYRSGGSMMPTIDFDLKVKVAAPASAAPVSVADGAHPNAPNGAAPAAVLTRFSLANARPAADQPGRLPENARAEISKLNGSSVELVSTPRGALSAQRFQLAGNNPDLQPLVAGSADALTSVVLLYPDVPVGVGGFWMVKSREAANGTEVIAYRMVRVTELLGDVARLSVNTRRYLVHPSLPLEGLPPHRVRKFESQGNATLSLRAGSAYPEQAELQDSFMALVAPNDRPNQALPVQSEFSAKLSFSP